jgi:hypothetical protein
MRYSPSPLVLWPIVLIACSSSPQETPSGQVAAVAGSGGSVSNGGGGSGATGPVTPIAGSSNGGASGGGGNGGAAAIAGGGASGSGGSTEAALGGAAGSSNGGAAGSSNDSPCSGLFCEDFEQGQGQLDPAKWDLQKGAGGTEVIQQQVVAHGKYALYVHGSGARGDFATILTKNAPMALRGAGPVFGRVYLYAAANLPAHIQLGFAGTTRDPNVPPSLMPMEKGINFNYMEFAEFSGSWQLGFDLFAPAPNIAKGFVEEASYPPARDKTPTAKWSCIEWELGDDPDMMVLWVEGKQLAQLDVQHIDFTTATRTPGSVLNGNNSGIIGGFDFFGFGFHSWGASAAVDRYYDDIVLDTKRVNCLP